MKKNTTAPFPSLYDLEDYKTFVRGAAESPGFGRGTYRRIAQKLRVNTTFVSQVVRGPKHFSVDQSLILGRFFGLGERELRYFLLLVQRDRAATQETRDYFAQELGDLREQARALVAQVPTHRKISEQAQGEFYSSYLYSAARLLTDIPGLGNPNAIAKRLGVDRGRVQQVLEFLTQAGLCISDQGQFRLGPAYTHINKDSALVQSHHKNWRLKAMQNQVAPTPDDLSFTAPLTVSRGDAKQIRSLLTKMVEQCSRIVEKSSSEELFCLNLDFFQV